jgi:hypothetical protein
MTTHAPINGVKISCSCLFCFIFLSSLTFYLICCARACLYLNLTACSCPPILHQQLTIRIRSSKSSLQMASPGIPLPFRTAIAKSLAMALSAWSTRPNLLAGRRPVATLPSRKSYRTSGSRYVQFTRSSKFFPRLSASY